MEKIESPKSEGRKVGAEQITICVKCKHHRALGPSGVWYDQVCAHPDVERPKGVDPVSGKMVYWSQNDLGMTVGSDNPHPYCRSINDGHCKLYDSTM